MQRTHCERFGSGIRGDWRTNAYIHVFRLGREHKKRGIYTVDHRPVVHVEIDFQDLRGCWKSADEWFLPIAIPNIQRRIFVATLCSTTSPSMPEFLRLDLTSTCGTRGSVLERDSPGGLGTLTSSGDDGEFR